MMAFNGKRSVILSFLALIFALELLFRIFGLFGPPQLFQKSTQGRERSLALNASYFSELPQLGQVRLNVDTCAYSNPKPSDVYRIFYVGHDIRSTNQDLFLLHLNQLLRGMDTTLRFQVVPVYLPVFKGEWAENIVRAILKESPDCILIYLGHDEYLGHEEIAPYHSGWIKLKSGLLKTSRIFRLIESANRPAGHLKTEISDSMYRHFSDSENVSKNFENVLERISVRCRNARVPVIFGTLTSNLSDFPPLKSRAPDHLAENLKDLYQSYVKGGDLHFHKKNYRLAVDAYRNAMALDSSTAYLWYQIGKSYEALHEKAPALSYLRGAKDRDLIHKRAPEAFNRRLREYPITDIQTRFDDFDAFRCPGNDLFAGDRKMTEAGQRVFADCCYQTIKNNFFSHRR